MSSSLSAPTVRLTGLTKTFGDLRAVDDVHAVALPGQVTALLGPNGAGKTTTLRLLLGLVAPTSGTATFDGQRYNELSEPVRRVGAVLEASGCHPGRTALGHLRVMSTAAGLPPQTAERVLDETGLTADANRRVGEYSLGMRQRLALAAALLGDPAVLVLDEPTNGLDPPGVRWLRRNVRRLADEGRTILLSSHALSEVELTADHVLVMVAGRLLKSSTLAELRAEVGVGSRVRAPHVARLADLLDAAGYTHRLTGDGLLTDATPEQVGELAAAHRIILHGLAETSNLEHAFFQLIQTADADDRTAPQQIRS